MTKAFFLTMVATAASVAVADAIVVTTKDKQTFVEGLPTSSAPIVRVCEGNPAAARLSERTDRLMQVSQTQVGPLELKSETYQKNLWMNVPGKADDAVISYTRAVFTLTNPTDKDIELDRFYFMKDAALPLDIKKGETGNKSINNTYTLSGLTAGQPVVLRVKAGTDGSGTTTADFAPN